MAGDYTRWYRVGYVDTEQNSKTIVGHGTYWLSAGINPGDLFTPDDGKTFFEIQSVTDDTHITLVTTYSYVSSAGNRYAIVRNFTANMPSDIAAQTAKLINDMARYWDEDRLTLQGESAYQIAKRLGLYAGNENSWINSLKGDSAYTVAKSNGYTGTQAEWLASLVGKSAYEVAVANGFTGTQAQWLESLKAAAEWSTLDARTSPLTVGLSHKALFRGKNLGSTVTDAQWQAIRSGSFDDLFPGDFWQINSKTYYIADLDYYYNTFYTTQTPTHHLVLMCNFGLTHYKADEDVSGGYYGSDIRTTFIPQMTQDYIIPAFGEAHLYKHQDFLCNAFNPTTGKTTGWIQVNDTCVELPCWQHVSPTPTLDTHTDLYTNTTLNYDMRNGISQGMFAYCKFRQPMWIWIRELGAKTNDVQYGISTTHGDMFGRSRVSENQMTNLFFTVCA